MAEAEMEKESVEEINAKEAKATVVVTATTRTKRAGVTEKTHAETKILRIVNASGARNGTKENAENLGHQQRTTGAVSPNKNSFL